MPGGRGNIRPEDGKPFSTDYQPPTNPGRPVKLFSALAKQFRERGIERATPEAVKEAYEYLLALPLTEIIEISGYPKVENDYPAILRLAAKEMTGKRGIEILKEMLDRAHGKAKQAMDVTSQGDKLSNNPLANLPLEKQEEIILMLYNDGAKK